MTVQQQAAIWLAARNVIAQALGDFKRRDHVSDQDQAAAILARLASHDPPLLVCTPDEVKEATDATR